MKCENAYQLLTVGKRSFDIMTIGWHKYMHLTAGNIIKLF